MNPQPFRSDKRHSGSESDLSVDSVRSTIISLAFWLSLLVAIGLYGLVVLSPKVVRWAERHQQVENNQQQLVDLKNQVDYWQRLTSELETNELFRHSFQALTADETTGSNGTIPVESSLRYQGLTSSVESHSVPSEPSTVLRVCERVASSRLLHATGLATSAAMLLIAFTSLVESRGPVRLPRLGRIRPHFRQRFGGIGRRYVSGTAVDEASAQPPRRIVTDV